MHSDWGCEGGKRRAAGLSGQVPAPAQLGTRAAGRRERQVGGGSAWRTHDGHGEEVVLAQVEGVDAGVSPDDERVQEVQDAVAGGVVERQRGQQPARDIIIIIMGGGRRLHSCDEPTGCEEGSERCGGARLGHGCEAVENAAMFP